MLRSVRIRLLLLILCAAVLAGCGLVKQQALRLGDLAARGGEGGRFGRLTTVEQQWARTAWRYFENNTNPQNGLVNGMDRSPTFSMSHLADYLAALMAARELELIEPREFEERFSRVLKFLNTMDLSEGSVPHKVYNSLTGKMVSYANQPADIGWSAVDTGRLLTWMKIYRERYPVYREYLDKAVFRMNFCQVIDDCGVLYGLSLENGRQRYQEGRLGYEQLGAAGFAAWGFDTRRIWSAPRMETVNIYGMPVRYDARESRLSGVQTPVLTMPHALLGIEFGWRHPGGDTGGLDWRQVATEIYRVQEQRYRRDGVLTARSDYQVREPPYLVLDTVFAAGYPWNTIGPDGKEYPKLSIVSTRAAFAMWVLWPGDYTDTLMTAVARLYHPDRGWYDGRLEHSGEIQETISLATNATVLEVLLFKRRGRLYPDTDTPGYLDRQIGNVLDRPGRCFPAERPACSAAPQSGPVPGR